MSLYLGIDGGGTKTACAVGDEKSVFAVAEASGSNVVRLGEDQARVGLHEAIARACTMAEVSPLRVVAACVGAAGAAHPDVNAAVKQMVRRVLPNAEVRVVGDMVIALEAAFEGQPGVVTIAGTGSIAYGRNAAGETARAGGWGYRISDEGSGQWIGRTAISEIMRAHDAGRETILLPRILEQWKLASCDELVRRSNSDPAPNFSELFPLVQQASKEHDELAAAVLSHAGRELARLTLTVLQRLFIAEAPVRIGVAGGVFAHSPEVRRGFYDALHSAWPGVSVCFQITEPIIGALRLARQLVPARTT
jgi:glucosamine kinase